MQTVLKRVDTLMLDPRCLRYVLIKQLIKDERRIPTLKGVSAAKNLYLAREGTMCVQM
jgi:hypothetical protein